MTDLPCSTHKLFVSGFLSVLLFVSLGSCQESLHALLHAPGNLCAAGMVKVLLYACNLHVCVCHVCVCLCVYASLYSVARALFYWAESEEPGWLDTHVEAHVSIAGPPLGAPKAVSALLSGESRVTHTHPPPHTITHLHTYAHARALLISPLALTTYS